MSSYFNFKQTQVKDEAQVKKIYDELLKKGAWKVLC